MTSHHGFSRRLLAAASVAAVAIVVTALGPGSGTAKAAPPSSDPTPARPFGVAAHGSIAVGGRPKLAGGLATLKSGRQQVFVQLAGEGAADAATAVRSRGAGEPEGRCDVGSHGSEGSECGRVRLRPRQGLKCPSVVPGG